MNSYKKIVSMLNDGRFHSGTELGHSLGISRAAIWAAIRRLRLVGVPVNSVQGRGYRLGRRVEWLDEAAIRQELSAVSSGIVSSLETLESIESTNGYLMELGRSGQRGVGAVCLAEMQTSGRGRMGRTWVSPFAANIYLSLIWRFEKGFASLSRLSPLLALAIVEKLQAAGFSGLSTKWPNDILLDGRKVAGILVDAFGEGAGQCVAVIGIGLNVSAEGLGGLAFDCAALGEQPHTATRNQLAAVLINAVFELLAEYDSHQGEPFRAWWRLHDLFYQRWVRLVLPSGKVEGVCLGIDEGGRLELLRPDGVVDRYSVGEVTLRGRE